MTQRRPAELTVFSLSGRAPDFALTIESDVPGYSHAVRDPRPLRGRFDAGLSFDVDGETYDGARVLRVLQAFMAATIAKAQQDAERRAAERSTVKEQP